MDNAPLPFKQDRKRLDIAVAAMQGILASGLANPEKQSHFNNIAEDSFRMADAMLKEENNGTTK